MTGRQKDDPRVGFGWIEVRCMLRLRLICRNILRRVIVEVGGVYMCCRRSGVVVRMILMKDCECGSER